MASLREYHYASKNAMFQALGLYLRSRNRHERSRSGAHGILAGTQCIHCKKKTLIG